MILFPVYMCKSPIDDGYDFECHHYRKCRSDVPYDYQATSQHTLEAAAIEYSFLGEHRGLSLLKDMLLRRMHTGIRASIFTNDVLQLQTTVPFRSIRPGV
jgi:hypothetical protein